MPDHLLLITIDTLRADHVSCYGNSPVATPAIDGFATAGARFGQQLTSISATLASHASLMTGCTPTVHGITWNGLSHPMRRRTLAQIAATAGYRTSAITSWGGFALQACYGFEHALSEGPARSLHNLGERTLERTLDWMQQANPDVPQFLWVHFIDPHAPDIAPPPYTQDYAGSVAYADMIVGRFLDAWDARFGADRTLAILTADHGEHLCDHGVERGHGTLWEVCLHVPLLIRRPGMIEAGRVVPELTRQIDVAPTLLDYAGLPMPHNMEGMSLRGLIEGTDEGLGLVHHAQAIRDETYTDTIRNADYAFHFGDGRNLAGVYDRRADRSETENLASHGAVVRHSAEHSIADATETSTP